MKENNKFKDNVNARNEYLKRVNSPSYVHKVKRNVELISTYSRFIKSKNTKSQIRKIASYFADDLRNPIIKISQVKENKDG